MEGLINTDLLFVVSRIPKDVRDLMQKYPLLLGGDLYAEPYQARRLVILTFLALTTPISRWQPKNSVCPAKDGFTKRNMLSQFYHLRGFQFNLSSGGNIPT